MTRTRIAPSPTGYPHIGTIYQALFNWAWAKKNEGNFLVRIEDTDRARFVEGAEDVIFSSLDWCGLVEDESVRKGGAHVPYRQSERLAIYHKYAQELIENGHAYYDYYPKEQVVGKKDYSAKDDFVPISEKINEQKSPGSIREMIEKGDWVIRMKVPQDEKIIVSDVIRGNIEFDTNQIPSQVLIKSDGFPTYHLGVVIDDHLMGVTDVIRGEEWISSTPRHVLLYKYFKWELPKFYHTPVLRNPDKSKLSKRHGHTSVGFYREEGFLPEAILNFLALMGWSHPEEKEIFSSEEFVSLFNPKDLKPAGPIFDLKKLEWMNGEYLRKLEVKNLKSKVIEFDPSLKEIDEAVLEKLLLVAQTRMKTLKEFRELIEPFILTPGKPVRAELTSDEKEMKESLKQDLENVEDWNQENLSTIIFENYIKPKRANFKTLYRIVIGTDRGLPLVDTFAAIGKEKTLKLL